MNALQMVWADVSQAGVNFGALVDPPMGSWRLLIRDCSWNNIFSHQPLTPGKSEEVEWKIHVVKLYFALSKYFRLALWAPRIVLTTDVFSKVHSWALTFLFCTNTQRKLPLLPKKTTLKWYTKFNRLGDDASDFTGIHSDFLWLECVQVS